VEEVAIFERRSQQQAAIAVWYSLFSPYLTLTVFPASTRTRSSGRSWGSVTRRTRQTAGTSTMVSDVSLSPIPSLATLPNNDFGTSLASSILEKGVFERVEEEDESQFAGPSASSHMTSSGAEETKGTESDDRQKPPIKVVVTSDPGMVSSGSSAPTTSSSNAQIRHQPQRSPASKPISPSAIASGSWIANRMQEPVFSGGLYRSAPTPTPSPNPSHYSSNSSVSSPIGRAVSVPLARSPTNNRDGSQASDSSPPSRNVAMSPGTTPTQPLAIRKAGSANALNMVHQEMAYDPRSTGRKGSFSSNQNNRLVSVYSPSGPKSFTTLRDDPMAQYAAYSTDPSFLPYFIPPSPTTPTSHTINHPSPPTRALPASPPASKMLDLPKSNAPSATRHTREMSSSSTSGSDLDLSRYHFPEAPGQQPTVLQRETHPASLDMIVEGGNGREILPRFPQELRKPQQQQQPTPVSSSPPRTTSRAPVLPGAYQAALRSAMEADVPDGPPPLYQPRASRRYHADIPQDQDYPEPSPPASYSPLRVASPASKGGVRLLDTSSAMLRSSQRAGVSASPLSETYSPAEGSPTDKYPPEVRSTEKAHYAGQRSASGRRPSDPYHRLLSAAAKVSTPPPPMSRRGSSSYLQSQGLSPHTAMSPHSFNSDSFDSSYEQSSSDPRSRPPSQAFSTYTRGTRHSTWGASQATATAVDHHEFDFPQDDDDGMFYTSMLADLDGSENERGRIFKEAISAKGPKTSTGKEPQRMHAFPSPPMPQIPRNLAFTKHQVFSEPALSRSPSRQLPTPPLGPQATPTPGPAHPYFPGGMGWDELNRPTPRKLSRMEKALLRRVEFGPKTTAANVVAIPLA
jgi:hypothetical protein